MKPGVVQEPRSSMLPEPRVCPAPTHFLPSKPPMTGSLTTEFCTTGENLLAPQYLPGSVHVTAGHVELTVTCFRVSIPLCAGRSKSRHHRILLPLAAREGGHVNRCPCPVRAALSKELRAGSLNFTPTLQTPWAYPAPCGSQVPCTPPSLQAAPSFAKPQKLANPAFAHVLQNWL